MTTSANALTERLNQQQYTPKFQIFFLKSFKTSEISKISEKCPATKQISGKDQDIIWQQKTAFPIPRTHGDVLNQQEAPDSLTRG